LLQGECLADSTQRPAFSQHRDGTCPAQTSLSGTSLSSTSSETTRALGDLSMLSKNDSSRCMEPPNTSSVSLHGITTLSTATNRLDNSGAGAALAGGDMTEGIVAAEHPGREPSQKRMHRQSLACWLDSSPPASLPGSPASSHQDLQYLQHLVQGKVSHGR